MKSNVFKSETIGVAAFSTTHFVELRSRMEMMSGGCVKKITGDSDDDRISNLPDGLQELILDNLDLREAVRTSVLSKKWRYCWTGMRDIDLSEDFFYGLEDLNEEYTTLLDRLIGLHTGFIDLFKLYLPVDEEVETHDVSGWLDFLSKRRIKHMCINAEEYESFQMPSAIFRCQSLRNLILWGCILTPPVDSQGFSMLVRLHLYNVQVQSNSFGNLITRCPQLQTLIIHTETSFEQPLVLKSSTLEKFVYEGVSWCDIIFKHVPCLMEAAFQAYEKIGIQIQQPHCLCQKMCSLSGISKLSLDCFLLEHINADRPSRLQTPLENLSFLTFTNVNVYSWDHLSFALCLVRSSPHLQYLTIKLDFCQVEIDNDQAEVSLSSLKSEANKCINLSDLRTVSIRRAVGSRHEIMLVKIFLSQCPNLETLIVKPYKELTRTVEQRIRTEFMKLPRLSNKAELLYKPKCS